MEQYHNIADLPAHLPIFPLSGALLLPRWSLPLNIFEPRYLQMIDDALAGNRIIGMIQPADDEAGSDKLANVGCAGRVTSFSETDDGRYLINLTGICRFIVAGEIESQTAYRQVKASWLGYEHDLVPDKDTEPFDRKALLAALKYFTKQNNMDVDWAAIETAPMETLINALSAGCPLTMIERQALLEAPTLSSRAEVLISLLNMNDASDEKMTLQ